MRQDADLQKSFTYCLLVQGNKKEAEKLLIENPELVKKLPYIQIPFSSPGQPYQESSLLFFTAVELNDREITALLLRYGAPIDKGMHPHNNQDAHYSPLMGAIAKGRLEMVQFLLEKGADPNTTFNGHSILQAALLNHQLDTFQWLFEQPEFLRLVNRRLLSTSRELHLITGEPLFNRICLQIQEKVPAAVLKYPPVSLPPKDYLSIGEVNDTKSTLWMFSLFCKTHPEEQKNLADVMLDAYLVLDNPHTCIPYLRFLNDELARYYQTVHNETFPQLNPYLYQFFEINGLPYPIPNENFKGIKKFSALQKYLLLFFKQYGLTDEEKAFKWSGFIPAEIANESLKKLDFVTEDRYGHNLWHGKLSHMIQMFILICAISDGKIKLPASLSIKYFLESFIQPDQEEQYFWVRLRDARSFSDYSFVDPISLSAMIMYYGKTFNLPTLCDSLTDTFCKGFIKNFRAFQNRREFGLLTRKQFLTYWEEIDLHVFFQIPWLPGAKPFFIKKKHYPLPNNFFCNCYTEKTPTENPLAPAPPIIYQINEMPSPFKERFRCFPAEKNPFSELEHNNYPYIERHYLFNAINESMQSHKGAFLYGVTGTGKTTLALEYAKSENYEAIFYFDATDETTLFTAFQLFCQQMINETQQSPRERLEDNIENFLQNELTAGKKILIIIDNFLGSVSMRDSLVDIVTLADTLIISSKNAFTFNKKPIAVLPFTEKEAISFLNQLILNRYPTDQEQAAIQSLATQLSYHPKMLRQIGVDMERKNILPTNYLSLFSNNPRDLLSNLSEESVIEAFTNLVEKISVSLIIQRSELPPCIIPPKVVLELISLFNVNIPFPLLAHSVAASLRSSNRPSVELELKIVLKKLQRYFLIKQKNGEIKPLSPLLQIIFQPQNKKLLIERMVQALFACEKTLLPQAIQPFTQALIDHYEKNQPRSPFLRQLLSLQRRLNLANQTLLSPRQAGLFLHPSSLPVLEEPPPHHLQSRSCH